MLILKVWLLTDTSRLYTMAKRIASMATNIANYYKNKIICYYL